MTTYPQGGFADGRIPKWVVGTQSQPLRTLAPVMGHAACTWGVSGWMEKTEPVSFVCVSFSREGLGEAGIVDSSVL